MKGFGEEPKDAIGQDDKEKKRQDEFEEDNSKVKKQRVIKVLAHFEGDDIDIFDIQRVEGNLERTNPSFLDDDVPEVFKSNHAVEFGIRIRFNSNPYSKEYWFATENRRDGRYADLRERLSEKGVMFI